MKFPSQESFDKLFAEVKGAKWYPYVGKNFGKQGRRILVYAHNIPIKPNLYGKRQQQWEDPKSWANSIEEYAYVQADYTQAFRYFVKAAAGLKKTTTRTLCQM